MLSPTHGGTADAASSGSPKAQFLIAQQSPAQKDGQGHASAGETGAEDNPVIATVNRREIRVSDVYDVIETLPLGQQIDIRDRIEQFAESLITEEILFQSVLADDFAGLDDLREEIKSAVVNRLIEKHIRSRISVSDEDIAAYYRESKDLVEGKHVRISHILRRETSECESILGQIESAEDFNSLVKSHSVDRDSVLRNGDIGYFMNADGPLGFERKLFDLAEGDIRMFISQEGCHVILVTDIVIPEPRTMEEIRASLRPFLERQQEQTLLREYIQEANARVRVERNFDALQ